MVDPAVRAALQPFERRAVLVAFVRASLTSLLAIALAAEIAMLFGARSALALPALVLAGLVTSAIYATTSRPETLALVRRVDSRARLDDLVVSAAQCEGDGMPALVRNAGISALEKVLPRVVYPIEPPRYMRQWIIAAAIVQVVALPLALRAPTSRSPQLGMSTLVLPPASGTAPSAAQRGERNSTAAPSTPAVTPGQSSPGQEKTSASATALSAATQTAAPGTNAAESGGADSRLRLAAANAADDLANGRVPIARRAIVEKYFATLQAQRKHR